MQHKVTSLFDSASLSWDLQKLLDFGGESIASAIVNEHQGLVLRQGIPDKIMYTWAANGEFSVKKAYQMLDTLQPLERYVVSDLEKAVWKEIWKIKGIAPRVRIFFWKIVKGALPTSHALAKRIPTISSQSKICLNPLEDAFHAIFYCPHARATWFMSPLGLRTSDVTHNRMVDTLFELWSRFDNVQIALFMVLAWNIWKARCKEFFLEKKSVPENTLNTVMALMNRQTSDLNYAIQRDGDQSNAQGGELLKQVNYCAWSDGSFGPCEGGAAFLIWHKEQLLRYELRSFQKAVSPFHMEVSAMLMAIKHAISLSVFSFRIHNCW